jgi:uncharacterized protein YjbJ (UPF0337 family)
MNTHQIKGRFSQASGRVKELAGKLFGNKPLESRGQVKKTGGKVQAGYGDIKDDIRKHS